MVSSSDNQRKFSKRHGYTPESPPITIWEDAPEKFRCAVLAAATGACKLLPSELRQIVCDTLHRRPNGGNWTERPNVWTEVEDLVHSCEWFRVYDIVERIASQFNPYGPIWTRFTDEINDSLRELGIGWQLEEGIIKSRGDDSHETSLASAKEALGDAGMPTARSELSEAVSDLSRRPDPDLSGAVQHAMNALECVLRSVSGETKLTAGQIIASSKNPIPKPLDQAVEKVWGYASNEARHGKEDREISRAEAQLIVGLASSIATYLLQKDEKEG